MEPIQSIVRFERGILDGARLSVSNHTTCITAKTPFACHTYSYSYIDHDGPMPTPVYVMDEVTPLRLEIENWMHDAWYVSPDEEFGHLETVAAIMVAGAVTPHEVFPLDQ